MWAPLLPGWNSHIRGLVSHQGIIILNCETKQSHNRGNCWTEGSHNRETIVLHLPISTVLFNPLCWDSSEHFLVWLSCTWTVVYRHASWFETCTADTVSTVHPHCIHSVSNWNFKKFPDVLKHQWGQWIAPNRIILLPFGHKTKVAGWSII